MHLLMSFCKLSARFGPIPSALRITVFRNKDIFLVDAIISDLFKKKL